MSEIDDKEIIQEAKASLGSRLCILAHHYQQDEIVQHADYTGDSLELARQIPELNAEHIIMCGVYFMAESAAILARSGQKVYIPETGAGCVLSNMAPASLVQDKLQELNSGGQKVVPLAYVNTSAAVKAVCADYQGSVCTSANASTMLDWALGQGQGVLFLPDKNLARNTANQLQIPREKRLQLSLIRGVQEQARLYIWPGVCSVHQKFKPAQIDRVRAEDPQARVIVHPECSEAVVAKADASGSTSKIIDYVRQAPAGSRIYIGTELNLVKRLAQQEAQEKDILPLRQVQCVNMAKIAQHKLASLLQELDQGQQVQVREEVQEKALLALRRMLEVCA
ncbi:MAG: quinolinate synthase NadA [Thermodesulfobacteriota bacterium]